MDGATPRRAGTAGTQRPQRARWRGRCVTAPASLGEGGKEDGTWLRLWRVVLGRLDAQGRLDWRYGFLDGSFAPAKQGATASG